MTETNILQGNFVRGTLAHTIQFLATSNREGRLTLQSGPQTAQIIFFDGQAIVATCNASMGEAAVASILSFETGSFEFVRLLINPGSFPEGARISRMLSNLLMSTQSEQSSQSNPAATFEQKITGASVPTLQPPKHGNPVHLEQMAWTLMPKMDGNRTVSEIARELQLSEQSVILELQSMLANGLIQVTQRISHVPTGLVDEVRKVVVQLTGPMGSIMLEDVADDLEVDLQALPMTSLREFLTLIQMQMPSERQAVYANAINQILKHFRLI
jgi:Domain of unknown function (DUF4388)